MSEAHILNGEIHLIDDEYLEQTVKLPETSATGREERESAKTAGSLSSQS